MFENLTPEVGRFLHDNLLTESQAFFNLVAANAPNWHVCNREAYVGQELGIDSLINAFGMFNAQVYILGSGSFVDTLGRYDAAFFRHGDLYQIRRLVANLRCQDGGPDLGERLLTEVDHAQNHNHYHDRDVANVSGRRGARDGLAASGRQRRTHQPHL